MQFSNYLTYLLVHNNHIYHYSAHCNICLQNQHYVFSKYVLFFVYQLMMHNAYNEVFYIQNNGHFIQLSDLFTWLE